MHLQKAMDAADIGTKIVGVPMPLTNPVTQTNCFVESTEMWLNISSEVIAQVRPSHTITRDETRPVNRPAITTATTAPIPREAWMMPACVAE